MSSVNVLLPAADTALPAVEIESLAAAKPALFELGQVVHTAEIGHWAEQYLPNELLVDDLWLNILVMAHVTGCWDELPAEDRTLNLRSLKKGEEGRIFSAFTILDEPIYVITERDRSCTTVLLASDY